MGRKRAAVIGQGRRSGSGGVPFMLALIGVPVLILAYLVGSSAPPAPPTASLPLATLPQPPVPSSAPSPGVTTRYAALPPHPVAAPAVPTPVAPGVGPPAPSPVERAAGRMQVVAGPKGALRAEPSPKGEILDRYEKGQAVEVLGRSGAWTHVRHIPTQREGWIQAKGLRDAPTGLEAEARPPPRPATVSPGPSDAAIATLLIERSIADYPGPCACPYQSARNGSSCGRRAAYVRPGGAAPLCYAKDVTPAMIAAYRAGQ